MNSSASFKKIPLLAVLFFSSSAAVAADGKSFLDCSNRAGESQAYIDSVCIPVQNHINELFSSSAQAPSPIVMTNLLDMQDYRAKGIAAIVQSSSLSGGSKVNDPNKDQNNNANNASGFVLTQ